MKVLLLTVFLSLVLALFFVVFFLTQHRRRPFASAESDALLPFADEDPRPAAGAPAADLTLADPAPPHRA